MGWRCSGSAGAVAGVRDAGACSGDEAGEQERRGREGAGRGGGLAGRRCVPHCVSHCVCHTVSLTVSATLCLLLCLPHCLSLCLPHCVSHCVCHTVSLTVSATLCLSLCLPHCVSHCVCLPNAVPGGLNDRRRLFLIEQIPAWLNAAVNNYRVRVCGTPPPSVIVSGAASRQLVAPHRWVCGPGWACGHARQPRQTPSRGRSRA
jgi:hypothetical protein